MITAEVTPIATKSREAALALQNIGFKVLHIGQSITISGEQELFEQIFKTKLSKLSKGVLPDLLPSAKTEFFRPTKPLVIPDELKSLISDIVFPEPPEFM